MSDVKKTTLKSPRFHSFLTAQFMGAANDNAYKMVITTFIVHAQLSMIESAKEQVLYCSLLAAVMPVAFLMFSPVAGYVADRYSKHRVLFWAKMPEILAMVLATMALYMQNLTLMFIAFFFMCVQSAFFSPAKYGLFPEVFDDKDLSMANGVLNMTTNIAILSGTVLGAFAYGAFKPTQRTEPDLMWVGLILFGVAVIGTTFIWFSPRGRSGSTNAPFRWNIFSSVVRDYKKVSEIRVLFYTILGIAYFYFLGSLLIILIPVYGKNVLGLVANDTPLLLAILTIGVAIGSLLAGRLSHGRVEIGLVPMGGIGLALFSLDMALFGYNPNTYGSFNTRVVIDLILLGISSGLFIVPLFSLLQQRSPRDEKGRFIAFSNVVSFIGVLLSAIFTWSMTNHFGLTVEQVLLFAAIITFFSTFLILRLVPDFFVRFVIWLMANTIYRIRVIGEENLPEEGGLLVANHVSWVDALIITGSCDRILRFMMYRPFYEAKAFHWFFSNMHVIPVAGGDPPEKKEESLAHARSEMDNGHMICIFAEGRISRTGNILKFKRGFETIMKGSNCPIVPVYMDGLWGSIFSFEGGKFIFKWPKRFPYPVTVLFGKPQPSTSQAHEIRREIQTLSSEAFHHREMTSLTLPAEFIKKAKRNWRKPFVSGSEIGTLTFGQVVSKALSLRDTLFAKDHSKECIGVLLPASVHSALSNIAILAAKKVVVNIDYEEPKEAIEKAIKQADIKKVITSRKFFDTLALEETFKNCELILVEEVMARSSSHFYNTVLGLLPTSMAISYALGKVTNEQNQDTATVIFTTHSQGSVKGVVLSHYNILSNVEAIRQIFAVSVDDCILGALPLSYSYGFTGTLWLPAIAGAQVCYHNDPKDSETIGKLAKKHKVSILPASVDMLTLYLEKVAKEDFAALRYVAGDLLDQEFCQRFQEKYGVLPSVGYGRPECSPFVTLNVPDYIGDDDHQFGSQENSIGHPLPGVTIKVVDPDSHESLPLDTAGLLFVKGPNVMKEYLDNSEATEAILQDGWLNTGVFGKIDKEGFIAVEKQ